METENKTNTKLNVADFLELRRYFQNGEYQKIDKWFERNKISENPELESRVVEKIINSPNFFSFNCFVFNNEYVNNEKTKREIAILKNLSLKNQLILLSPAGIDEVNSDHFKVIKLTPENRKILESSEKIAFITTKFFWSENFAEIDKIQEILGFNVMEQKVKTVIFCKGKPYSSNGATYLQISKSIFSPKCDIIFNFSEEKRKFLEERNITLPSIEETDILYDEIKKSIKNNEYYSVYKNIEEKLDQSFNEYKAVKLSLDLENKLQVKNDTRKKIKV